MHGRFLPRGASSADGRISLLCIAECALVSGRGYYAAGPTRDVLRRPDRREGVLARPPDGVNAKNTACTPVSVRNAGDLAKAGSQPYEVAVVGATVTRQLSTAHSAGYLC